MPDLSEKEEKDVGDLLDAFERVEADVGLSEEKLVDPGSCHVRDCDPDQDNDHGEDDVGLFELSPVLEELEVIGS